jgi:hypothetical protein
LFQLLTIKNSCGPLNTQFLEKFDLVKIIQNQHKHIID